MLVLVYAQEGNPIWYEFQNIKNRSNFFTYMFGVVDTEKCIFYYCTQYDIEKKFMNKGKHIKGVYSIHNKMTDFVVQRLEGISVKSEWVTMNSIYKIVLGCNVSLRSMHFGYKNILVYRTDGMLTIHDFDSDIFRVNMIKYKNNLFLNKREDKYCVERHVNLSFVSFDSIDINYMIDCFNKWARTNIVNDYSAMFSHTLESVLDLRNLYCKDVLNMHRMFSGCANLSIVKFCKLDLRVPISLSAMFLECDKLETIDFSLLKNDIPNEIHELIKDRQDIYLMDMLGLLNMCFEKELFTKYCICVLPNTAPIFNAYFVLSNKLKFLGYIDKKKDIMKQVDFQRSKLILKGVPTNQDIYYIIAR